MPVVLPPSTQPVPNGYTSPPNVVATFVLNTGDTVTWGVTGSQIGAGGGSSTHEFGYYLYEEGVGTPPFGGLVVTMAPNWGAAEQTSYTATRPIGCRLQLQIGGNATTAPTGTAFGVFATTTLSSTANCAYGTQRKFGVPAVLTLTPDQILALLTAGGWGWLQNALAFLNFSNLDVESLCRAGPPPLPVIDTSTLSAGAATWVKIFHSVIWGQLCECVPGTPAPIPFPTPSQPEPTGWPPRLTFACDPADICAALVTIQQQLAALLQTTGSNLELTTLIQRYDAPFAYIKGARHAGLTGSGAFQVPRCVGFLVEFIEWPAGLETFTGAPVYISDLGWLSTLSNEGMLDEVRLTRQAQVWLPAGATAATQCGYGLREGVVADIVELYAEP